MTANSPIRTRTLLYAAALFAASGCLLIAIALPGASQSDRALPAHTAQVSAVAPSQDTRETGTSASTTRPARSGVPAAGLLPPPGSGPAADPLVQRALEQAMPPDLPAATGRELAALGRAVWNAEVTGIDRQKWPRHFTQPVTAPYTRVRIQAAVARRNPDHAGTNTAVVHLVWAGADPSGTYLDGRPATVRLTREGVTWNPVR
ncbi:hypothetical protein [Streptomyces sp. MS2.AVA.5]|uniref:Uncharacterized protein n=1 Tax=Streptomyces achmelvichensis TaxID=3134111 RepID=A0ACC6Q9E2_9ACTN